MEDPEIILPVDDQVINGRSAMGRRNRLRGKQVENEIVNLLRDSGIAAERVSRVGYTGPDIQVHDEYLAEVKLRKGGFKTISRWLSGVNILFLREHGVRLPYVVIRFDLFVKLMGGKS
jgi:Holliday junction resolvase